MVYRKDKNAKIVECNHCKSKNTIKAGFDRKDKTRQRYYCRDCERYSLENTISRKRKTNYAEKLDVLPSERRLILELQELAKELGKTPRTYDIRSLSKEKKCHTLENYYAVFGSYVTAVKAANLKQHYRQEFDKNKLLCELRRLGRTFDRPMYEKDVIEARRNRLVSPSNHFDKAFGSVSIAIEKSGVNKKYHFDDFEYLPRDGGQYLPRAKKYSREEFIRHLKKLELKIGYVPRQKDIVKNYKKDITPSLKAYLREFGTLSKARTAAHIPNAQWKKFSKPKLVKQLKMLGKKLGRKPTNLEIVKACSEGKTASAQVFMNEFGSLIAAYKAAGFTVLKPKEYTDREIIKRLRKLRRKLGKRIGWNDLDRASKEGWCPSPNTVYRRLGNVERIEEILMGG